MDFSKILILGFGNSTRGDDGAGWEVIRRLDALDLPGLETRVSQQLGLELLEEWGGYEKVLFVDAAPGGAEARLERVVESEATPSASTHHLKPETLLHLSRQLYGRCPGLYLCRIPAEQFGFGDGFSPSTGRHIEQAVVLIREWLEGTQAKKGRRVARQRSKDPA